MTARRAALGGMLAAKLVGAWGLAWDIRWHLTIGRDSFWIAPHIMMYASVGAGIVLAFGVLARETLAARGARAPAGAIRILGLVGTRGFHLAGWGLALVVLAAPIDDLWHRLFGLDVTIWSPPHLLGLLGSAVNTAACALIATEVYPRSSRARDAAIVMAGALLYGGLRVTVDPAWLLTYTRGGLAFHAPSILAAGILPLALVPAARLTGRRLAPVAVVLVALVVALGGNLVARAGFALLEPPSALSEEIAKDPTSAIALGSEIERKNRDARGPLPLRLALPLLPALVLAVVDPRRRAVAGAVAYGVAYLTVFGWYTLQLPAFAPMAAGPGETVVALGLVVAAAALGGLGARWLATRLAGGPAAFERPALEPTNASAV